MALTIRRLIPKVSTLNSKIFGLHGVHTSFLLNNSVCDARKKTRSRCTLIPGDGVGPELVEAVQDVFKHMNVPVDFESFQLSETGPETSTPFEYVANSITRNRVCLKGIIGSPGMEESNKLQTLNMKMRKELDLYANVVHIRSLDGVNAKHKNIDLVVIREHTEGEYSALEHEVVKGVVECLKVVTAWKSQRIAKFAFDYATRHNRKKVTAVHKANIMKLGDGLFLKSCREVSKHYPHIEYQTIIVDNCTMQMVSKPQQFDVLLTPNLYGNLVDNIGAGLVGGAGVVAGASYSADCVVFEPGARHRFIEAAGKNIANPTALLLCSALLLDHLNLDSHAKAIKSAVEKVLKDGAVKTADLGGNASTKDFTEAVIANVQPDGGRT